MRVDPDELIASEVKDVSGWEIWLMTTPWLLTIYMLPVTVPASAQRNGNVINRSISCLNPYLVGFGV